MPSVHRGKKKSRYSKHLVSMGFYKRRDRGSYRTWKLIIGHFSITAICTEGKNGTCYGFSITASLNIHSYYGHFTKNNINKGSHYLSSQLKSIHQHSNLTCKIEGKKSCDVAGSENCFPGFVTSFLNVINHKQLNEVQLNCNQCELQKQRGACHLPPLAE